MVTDVLMINIHWERKNREEKKIFLIKMNRLPCLRPKQRFDSIEYEIDESQISFLLPSSILTKCSSSSPTLLTFPLNITLKNLLKEEQIQQMISVHFSATNETIDKIYFELHGKILNENLEFNSIIEKEDLILFVNNSQLKFHESENIQLDSKVINQFRESLIHRLPILNGCRPQTNQHRTYPNESLDLLFDTLDGQLNYLTKYLLSHFGERHEFLIYEIQKQINIEEKQWNEWETGIYRMHGDENGTINIALASDW